MCARLPGAGAIGRGRGVHGGANCRLSAEMLWFLAVPCSRSRRACVWVCVGCISRASLHELSHSLLPRSPPAPGIHAQHRSSHAAPNQPPGRYCPSQSSPITAHCGFSAGRDAAAHTRPSRAVIRPQTPHRVVTSESRAAIQRLQAPPRGDKRSQYAGQAVSFLDSLACEELAPVKMLCRPPKALGSRAHLVRQSINRTSVRMQKDRRII